MAPSPSKPRFTICIPSYNRGGMALSLVRDTLERIDDDWEVLVLDNGSHTHREEYRELAAMAESDPRLSYVRHPVERGFHGNYLACFEYARADHLMAISDEDFPNTAMIREVLPYLESHPELGILRGSVQPLPGKSPVNAFMMGEAFYARGNEAMLGYGMFNNYFSGTIYHRELIRRHGLLERLRHGMDLQRLYPQIYFELLVCAVCDVATTPKTACFEGEEICYADGNPRMYKPPYSFGSRVDQFFILRDAIREAVGLVREPYDHNLFVTMYLLLCQKYFFLTSQVNMPLYVNNQLHPGLLQKSMLYACAAGISIYPELAPASDEIFARIADIYQRFNLFPEQKG